MEFKNKKIRRTGHYERLKKNIKLKKIFLLSFIVILFLGICFIILEKNHITNFINQSEKSESNSNQTININDEPATEEQIKAGNETKSGSTSDTPEQPATIEGSDKKIVQVLITAANQNESFLQIRTLISALESTGTCTLTLTNDQNKTVTKTASVQAQSTTSTCKGFDVPTSELSTGNWHISVSYSSDNLQGSATQDIVIK